MLEGRKKKVEHATKRTRSSSPSINVSENGTFRPPNDDSIMTRKPIRIRRQRIPVLQSGYCAICNLPYNSVEDHVQSKKHQKLIGEDANYIALNGYIHADVGIESLLGLTGIDAIGFDDFTPKTRRRNMPRTRTSSAVSDSAKPTQTNENEKGHRLRSRKSINYMTPPLDEDSFQEKPDLEPVRLEYKEYRELRSSTRALAKLTSCAAVQESNEPELWESGRPKRACINRQKSVPADERLVSDNQAYYKVEVLSSKLRSTDKDKGTSKQKDSKSNNTDKGLIVKFKKLRTSELVQLNNEATNFLFPKKDDSSSDEADEEVDTEGNGTEDETEATSSESIEVCSLSEVEDVKPPEKLKVEDEASVDSISSVSKIRKKRRTHAEAFIMDNLKYYKFEMPGTSSYRLRYHGSYLSPVPTKSNGDLTRTDSKIEPKLEKEDNQEKAGKRRLNLEDFTFSFETVPEDEKWYQTFQRQDRSEQRYHFSHNYYWNDFVLPHKIPHLRPIDPRTCYNAYKELKDYLCKEITDSNSGDGSSGSDMEICEEIAKESPKPSEEVNQQAIAQTDEDSKLSEMSSGSAATTEEIKEIISGAVRPGRKRRSDVSPLSPSSSRGRNARKSPRQHASTLAILSSLGHQRKRRSRNGGISENLQTIPEEASPPKAIVEQRPVASSKPNSPRKQRKKKVDYCAIAAKIEEELNTALDFDLDFEPTTDLDVSFLGSGLNVNDVMRMYDESNAKENKLSCRRFFNGAPGRKPGKRKKNLTGWPNKVKRKKIVKSETESVHSGHVQSDEEEETGDAEDSISEARDAEVDVDDRENKCERDIENRVGNSSELRDTILQPYVYVKKLDSCEKYGVKKLIIKSPPKRIPRRPQRRRITTTKSPRMLRRPKGRWYRDI